ncbi:response regulator transcription factor [Luteolibacter flavescens]|uniref:Response regulator transcription factor n=1 Tax=Luteolibacter flavescens TaxID=1859460 RepID=A0ABT3FQ83_9BACT|nr:response regulator transcription factor [Luteolibacter flavescens]MCW1885349.1 response regulator transcription factor [Luteolibacter flavescens]
MSSLEPKRDLLIVDDHPIITLAVKSLVETMLTNYEPHTVHTAAAALEMAGRCKPAIAVVDISLPDGDGLDLVRRIKEAAPTCAVLVFSMQNELQYGARALKAGANGYLMKGDKVSAVVDAIRKIESGGMYASPALAEELLRNVAKPANSGIETFSDREYQVFRLLAEGHSTKEIALRLKISTKTVDSHIEHMKVKVGCSNKTELLLQARDWWRSTQGQGAS